ncbi:hypothetical protein GGR54DRAFT_590239 [Hypoxylon sp. NC1633]|nr:hypothetical protein GGR54DRAFT_590239 [Hypoxylon sp. NC1633]
MYGFSNWPGIRYSSNDFSDSFSYNWEVSWKPDCVMDELNIGQPIGTFSCQDAMRLAFDKCDNGGTVEYGCLVYSFSLKNLYDGQDDVSCSLPFL